MKINIYDDFNKKVATEIKVSNTSSPTTKYEEDYNERQAYKKMCQYLKANIDNSSDRLEFYYWDWS